LERHHWRRRDSEHPRPYRGVAITLAYRTAKQERQVPEWIAVTRVVGRHELAVASTRLVIWNRFQCHPEEQENPQNGIDRLPRK
jgi:ribosomal protein L39E